MKHFQPDPWKTKQDRYEEKQSEEPTPELPYNLWSISLFSPRPKDKAISFFISIRDPVDVECLQRCLDLAYPWRVDLYTVTKTVFQIQFMKPCQWRDITRYTQDAWEALDS